MTSRTEKAIVMVDAGQAPYSAAKQLGINPSVVYVALKKRRLAAEGVCPKCGQRREAAMAERRRIISALEDVAGRTESSTKREYFLAVVTWLKG